MVYTVFELSDTISNTPACSFSVLLALVCKHVLRTWPFLGGPSLIKARYRGGPGRRLEGVLPSASLWPLDWRQSAPRRGAASTALCPGGLDTEDARRPGVSWVQAPRNRIKFKLPWLLTMASYWRLRWGGRKGWVRGVGVVGKGVKLKGGLLAGWEGGGGATGEARCDAGRARTAKVIGGMTRRTARWHLLH